MSIGPQQERLNKLKASSAASFPASAFHGDTMNRSPLRNLGGAGHRTFASERNKRAGAGTGLPRQYEKEVQHLKGLTERLSKELKKV